MLDSRLHFIISAKLSMKKFFFVGGSNIPIKIKLLGGKECIIKQISRWALLRFELQTFKFSNFLFIMLNWGFFNA